MSKFKVELRPFVSKGEPIVRSNGDVEVVPVQLFRCASGTAFRVGDTVFFFDKEGRYDGTEHKATRVPPFQAERLVQLLQDCKENRNQAPDEPYFESGTKGWQHEMKSVELSSTTEDRAVYNTKPDKSESN